MGEPIVGRVYETEVTVWGRRVPVKLQQIGKSKHRAWGTYMDKSISAEGRSGTAALHTWGVIAKREGDA